MRISSTGSRVSSPPLQKAASAASCGGESETPLPQRVALKYIAETHPSSLSAQCLMRSASRFEPMMWQRASILRSAAWAVAVPGGSTATAAAVAVAVEVEEEEEVVE